MKDDNSMKFYDNSMKVFDKLTLCLNFNLSLRDMKFLSTGLFTE